MSGLLLRGGGQGGRAALGKWRDLPVSTDGLLGVFVLGQSLGASIKNRWGDDDATVVGAPTVNQYTLGLAGGVNYLLLPFNDPAALTIVWVGKSLDSSNAIGCGSSGNAGFGANIGLRPGTPNVYMQAYTMASDGSNSNSRERNLPGVAASSMKCLIGDADGTSIACADMSGTGGGTGAQRLVSTIGSGDQVRKDGAQMAIGGRGSGQPGATECSMAFVWARRISDAERAALYAQKILPMHQSWGFTTV
ncbi:hypothetical protein [Hansschlegelia beijingensis]|uniref:Uncharacterized protein n=1 Tax=Hansschlegelia beijingensis TaxID=1133344 RepID=A0A7W6CX80_9HYPH|nr:hypothetical protein [Hansschlegelia beijingensis]MBB3972790.1 hypothetical protein [Hansschlegelia beijingensis]